MGRDIDAAAQASHSEDHVASGLPALPQPQPSRSGIPHKRKRNLIERRSLSRPLEASDWPPLYRPSRTHMCFIFEVVTSMEVPVSLMCTLLLIAK